MKRIRMVGDFELIYEPDMKMFRILKKGTEKYSSWYTPEEAEELKKMGEDDFFATAEKVIQDSGGEEEIGDDHPEGKV